MVSKIARMNFWGAHRVVVGIRIRNEAQACFEQHRRSQLIAGEVLINGEFSIRVNIPDECDIRSREKAGCAGSRNLTEPRRPRCHPSVREKSPAPAGDAHATEREPLVINSRRRIEFHTRTILILNQHRNIQLQLSKPVPF